VALRIQEHEKDHSTVLVTGIAARPKLPLTLLASGKSERCEFSQLGNVEMHWRDHTQSRWATEDISIRYLRNVHQYSSDQLSIWFILDLYAALRTLRVRNFARRLNAHLAFMPAGFADELQRLGRAVFGAMKASSRRMFRRAISDDPLTRLTHCNAVQAWE
jgi:hypothetical protein